jgi:hypothetical protein
MNVHQQTCNLRKNKLRIIFYTRTMKTLTILFSVIFINSIGQHRTNGHDRLNKNEFEEVKKQKERFIPVDIKEDTIIVVRYSAARLEQLNALSRNLEEGEAILEGLSL